MSDQDIMPPPRPQRSNMIKGLVPRLPERGHIKIGNLGEQRQSTRGGTYQLPNKLDHFRVTTLDRGKDGNFTLDKALYEKLNLEAEPTELPVRLLYDDIGLNFPSRYACYSGKTLWCSGDGETATRVSDQWGKPQQRDAFSVPCTCHRAGAAYEGKDRCKLNGRLAVLIDGAGGVGGVWVFRTTSYNSVNGILSSLVFLRSITGGILANIPLKLRVQPKQATRPTDQQPVMIYVVSLEYGGDISELQETAHTIALERARTHLSIANIEEEARRSLALMDGRDAALPGDVAEDIVGEFYPEQVLEEMEGTVAPPRPMRPTRAQFEETYHPAPYEVDNPNEQPRNDPMNQPYGLGYPKTPQAQVDAERAAKVESQPSQDEAVPDYIDNVPPEDISQEPVDAFPVIDADGEYTEVPVGQLVEKLTAVFKEAANRGYNAWQGASESNDLREMLEDAGYADISAKIVEAWEDSDPRKIRSQQPAGQPPGGMGARRPPPQRAPQRVGDPVTIVQKPAPIERHDQFWAQNSYTVQRVLKQDRTINFQLLRDALMSYADQARSLDELRKFCQDNTDNIRQLRETFPNYERMVGDRVRLVDERLSGKG